MAKGSSHYRLMLILENVRDMKRNPEKILNSLTQLPNRTLDDRLPNTVAITGGRNGLITRLNARVCENCGATDNLEMHHVRKLKNLKGKSDWEIKMISRNRKTLAVCSICHHKIHSGKLN